MVGLCGIQGRQIFAIRYLPHRSLYKCNCDFDWLFMVCTVPNEHSVRIVESNPVRTHSNSLGAHPVVRAWRQCTS